MANTEHFNESELACNCGCDLYIENVSLLIVLENVRENFNKPVTITSGTRCRKHNEEIGGKKGSKHVLGQAADIVVKDIDPIEVYYWLDGQGYSDLLGLGRYDNFTHVDVRGSKARW